jgi:Carboxypeptidase regulatory-like domain/TonB-dependent Receptor Plug Domain
MRRFYCLFAVSILLFGTLPLMAQEQTASLEGVVTDPQGGAVPGVTVEAVGAGGQRYSAQTDGSGRYRFPAVPPGVYTITATLTGMQTATAKNVQVALGTSKKVDLQMKVAAVTESVTVTATGPIVDVTSSAASTSIRAESFEKLPRGRDFSTVVIQAPSANQNDKAGGISIDGASGAENRYIMDGVDTTNPQTGTQGKTLITDFVDEVQVKSSGYAAEFGGSTGGVINVVTRTGTNNFRGSVNTYYSDRSWGGKVRPVLQLNLANSGFDQFVSPKDDDKIWEPGATLGGPVLQDRLWFYGGYQPTIQSRTRTITFVPAQGGQTVSFDQDFKRQNWLGTLSGSAGTKLLYKGSFNSSGYEQEHLLPAVTGRGSSNPALYTPGEEFENWTASGYADFVASPVWFFSAKGGRFYRNFKENGISTDPRIVFTSGISSTVFPEIPATLVKPSAFSTIPTNTASQKDAYTRDNVNFDGSWYPSFAGTHRLKAGVQFDNISNDVLRGQQNFLVDANWNAVCSQCTGRGKYGSAAVYTRQTTGNVESKNTGFFIQDSWTTLSDRLTLNIGVRTEQERVPSYSTAGTTGTYAIEFDYADKVAPRLGFSYDIFANGRTKAYGSYGVFYDIMKMELPRGSFGGDKWISWGFDIDDFDWTKWTGCQNVTNDQALKPTCPGMTLRSSVDLRHPSNSADKPLIDPDLQPMKSREFTLGVQHELNNTMAIGFRYVNKSLLRAIEDVGVHNVHPDGSESEDFFIANPGYGVAQKILLAFGCTNCPAMPKATRDYDGYEVEFTKRYADRWEFHASYLFSKLRGNYSGLANSDEVTATPGVARTSPNVNRIFDSLFMLFDANGDEVSGPLGGDRPHQAKAQVSYTFPFGTTLGVNEYFYSGTPTTTEMRFQGAPIFPFGRNDLGRTPNITQTDINAFHTVRLARSNVTFGAIVTNLFDQKKVTNVYPIASATSIIIRDLSACGSGPVTVAACGDATKTPRIGPQTGSANNPTQASAFFGGNVDWQRQFDRQVALGLVPDWRYNQANTYQDPRDVRVYVKLTF